MVTGLAIAGALLLISGGAAKMRSPQPLARALRESQIPGGIAPVVRLLAIAEATVGAWSLMTAQRIAWMAVSASYIVVTAFLVVLRHRRGAMASCGCLGGADTPVTAAHLTVTSGYAAVAGLAALAGAPPGLASTSLGGGVALLIVAGALTYLSVLVLTALPQVTSIPSVRR